MKQRRVIVNGAQGKMGRLACDTIEHHAAFELVAGLGRNDDLKQAILETKADIVVELTRADCVYNNSQIIIENNAHPVIGATGLLTEEMQVLQSLCAAKKLGGLIAPNFSISAVLMMHFSAMAARFLSDVEIVEAHHEQKLDAPSGTALKTADVIADVRSLPEQSRALKEMIPGVRGGEYRDIHIHSLRLPGVLARQQVIFGSPGETLTILHDSIDRTCFMPGVILACEQVMELDGLYYGLEHVLGLT